MWHLKPTLMPVVKGTVKNIQTNIYNKSLKPSLTEIEKIVLTSTAHILRKALSI